MTTYKEYDNFTTLYDWDWYKGTSGGGAVTREDDQAKLAVPDNASSYALIHSQSSTYNGDWHMLCTFKIDYDNANTRPRMVIGSQCSGIPSSPYGQGMLPATGYVVVRVGNNYARLQKIVNNASVQQSPYGAQMVTPGVLYFCRMWKTGSTITARIWEAESSEMFAGDQFITDASPSDIPAGTFYASLQASNEDYYPPLNGALYIDNVTVTDGDPVPPAEFEAPPSNLDFTYSMEGNEDPPMAASATAVHPIVQAIDNGTPATPVEFAAPPLTASAQSPNATVATTSAPPYTLSPLTTETWTGNNGDAWNTSRWTVLRSTTGSTSLIADIQANAGRITFTNSSQGQYVRAITNASVAAGGDFDTTVAYVGASGALVHPYFGVGSTITSNTTTSTMTVGQGIWLQRGNGATGTWTLYSKGTTTATLATGISIPVSSTMRIQRIDGTVRLKHWATANPEPDAWTHEFTPVATALPTVAVYGFLALKAAVSASTTTGWVYYDNYSLGTPVVPPAGGTSDAMTAAATIVQPTISTVRQVAGLGGSMNAIASMPEPVTTASTVISTSHATGPATATALMNYAPVVTTSVIHVNHMATVLGASVVAPDPAVDAEQIFSPDFTGIAPALTASATAPDAKASLSAAVTAPALEASAESGNHLSYAYRLTVVPAAAATASAFLVPPQEAQGEQDDLYFQRLSEQLAGSGDLWFRFDEAAGPTADNRLGEDGTYVGGTFGGFGPEGRRVITLNGTSDYIDVADDDRLAAYSRMEMVFRTDKATQTLATGSDFIYPTNFGGPVRKTGLEMYNGRIRVYGGGNAFTGRTRLDDNNWHHVVWTMANGLCHIYIDGKLEMRRLLVEGGEINAIIDGIGGGPDTIDGYATVQDPAMFFRGDIMEFVYDKDGTLSEKEITGNYYAVFGIVPVTPEVMAATATMLDATGKGNRKRALGLWYHPDTVPAPRSGDRQENYNWTGLVTSERGVRTPHLNAYGQPVPFDMGEFKVFPKSVVRDESKDTSEYLGGAYYDEVTGERRYINVMEDMDASDYDMVFFINLPPRLNFAAGYGENATHLANLYEDLIANVRDLVDTGVSLWAPQPEVAIELGIVDTVVAHSMRRESTVTNDQGNALGLFDARAATVNPWDGDPTNGRYYYDNHALNRYRVTGLVEGLTDLPGWIDTDMFFGRPRDPFKPSFFGWRYADRSYGLDLGDEFMYGSQDEYNQWVESSYAGALLDRFSVVAVPPDAVNTGTVVTRENGGYYQGSSHLENPYREYATTIVVEPGDSLKGRPVGGRIFVNFMEGQEALAWTNYTLQLVPPNEQIPNPLEQEDDAKRLWGYSSFRTSIYGVTAQGAGAFVQQEGTIADANGIDQFGAAGIVGVSISEKYPTVSLRRYGMVERGLHWLAERTVIADGDAVVRTTALTASAEAPAPTVEAAKDVEFNAQPALASARIVSAGPDVDILVLPATAQATITGFGRVIQPEPATAHAEIVENFDMVFAGGEQIVLTLLGASSEVVLYMKEDA